MCFFTRIVCSLWESNTFYAATMLEWSRNVPTIRAIFIPGKHTLIKAYWFCLTFQKLTALAILFNINTSEILQDLFALSQSALMTCSTFVLQSLIELSLKLLGRFPLTSERADHPISLGCTCMPPSLHSHLQSSGYYYYLHRCFLIAFYLQSAVEEQVHKTATHSFKICCFYWNAFKKSTN